MMGRLNHDQRQLFYSFCLKDAVPDDHLVRAIAGVLDLSWVPAELAPYYPKLGRPSIDPVLMIRMLMVGYVFAILSKRALCRYVQVDLAYRWFCGAISRQAIDSGLIPGTAPRAVLLKYGTDSRIIIHRALPLPFHLPGVLPFTGCGTMPGNQPPRSSPFHAGKAALSTRPDQAVAL